jgi:hypothetical protein
VSISPVQLTQPHAGVCGHGARPRPPGVRGRRQGLRGQRAVLARLPGLGGRAQAPA